MTNAQAAALEAFEEAGVHGRIEEAAFTRYVRRKSGRRRSPGVEVTTDAHLCEVLGLEPPSESNRNPTWFSHEKAKRRLRDGRMPNYAAELGSVIDRAVIRIQSLDSLKKPVIPGHRA